MSTVGTRLKIARINANYRQTQVVEILSSKGYDISQNTLSRYENDKREIGLELLKLLSLLYRISPEKLLWSEQELAEIDRF